METKHRDGGSKWTKRPHFSPGHRLSAEALNSIATDQLRRQRLLTRALHGQGVVFGYALERDPAAGHDEGPDKPDDPKQRRDADRPASDPDAERAELRDALEIREEPGRRPDPDTASGHDPCGCHDRDRRPLKRTDHCIHITCGLIFDRHGRDLYWPGGPLGVHHVVGSKPKAAGWYVLRAHHAERRDPPDECGPCPSDDAQWVEQRVVFSLTLEAYPDCAAHPACPPADCATVCDYVCERSGSVWHPQPKDEHGWIPPADGLDDICIDGGPLCRIESGGWRYDAESGVPIACVKVHETKPAHCGAEFGFGPEPPKICSVRPVVVRTPVLYELIRDCHIDAAHIAGVGADWLRLITADQPVPWTALHDLLTGKEPFRIYFDKPIVARTLHEASVFLTVVIQDEEVDYWRAGRMPLDAVEPLDSGERAVKGDELAHSVRLVPSREWIEAELRQRRSSLNHGGYIELTVRGQLLRDRCGRMLDARPFDRPSAHPANPFYLDRHWAGQARPGDDFVAVFRFAPREGHTEPKHDHSTEGSKTS